jgi:cobalt-zinc-cadmium efflux system outer membrane protein
LLQAQVESQSVRVRFENARSSHQAAWRRLAAVVAVDLAAQPLAGELATDLPLADWEQSLLRVQSESPEVAAALTQVQRARSALQRACAEAKPNIDLQLGIQYDNATEDPISMVQVSVPVPIINRNQGGIRQAQAEIVEASRNADRLQRELQERLAGVFERYLNARQQTQAYAKEILPRAKETLDLVTTGYQAGELQYLTLLTAQRTYFETNLAYLEALEQLWLAHVEIESLLLTGSLAEPPPSTQARESP